MFCQDKNPERINGSFLRDGCKSCSQRRRLKGGTEGTAPQNLRWGTAQASTPNILRSSVVRCARKYEQSKKDVIKKLFSEIVVFLVKKLSYTTFDTVKIWKIWEKIGKIRKTWSMTKKTSFRNLGLRKNFLSPPNSAPGLRLCLQPHFPPVILRGCNLRPRTHNFCLPEKDNSNFIPKALHRFS